MESFMADASTLQVILFAASVGLGVWVFLYVGVGNIDRSDASFLYAPALSIVIWGPLALLGAGFFQIPAARTGVLIGLLAVEAAILASDWLYTSAWAYRRRYSKDQRSSSQAVVTARAGRKTAVARRAGRKAPARPWNWERRVIVAFPIALGGATFAFVFGAWLLEVGVGSLLALLGQLLAMMGWMCCGLALVLTPPIIWLAVRGLARRATRVTRSSAQPQMDGPGHRAVGAGRARSLGQGHRAD